MRTRTMVAMVLGALVMIASPRPAAAGGNFYFSFGLPLPVIPAPVVAPAPYYPYPYPAYPAPVYAPPVVYGPPVFGFGYSSGWCSRPGGYRTGPYYGPPYGRAYGYRASYGYRWH
jgi:hypothetical protein